MVGQAAPVFAVGPLAQKVEHLREGEGHDKVVGGVGVADKEEKSRPQGEIPLSRQRGSPA